MLFRFFSSFWHLGLSQLTIFTNRKFFFWFICSCLNFDALLNWFIAIGVVQHMIRTCFCKLLALEWDTFLHGFKISVAHCWFIGSYCRQFVFFLKCIPDSVWYNWALTRALDDFTNLISVSNITRIMFWEAILSQVCWLCFCQSSLTKNDDRYSFLIIWDVGIGNFKLNDKRNLEKKKLQPDSNLICNA